MFFRSARTSCRAFDPSTCNIFPYLLLLFFPVLFSFFSSFCPVTSCLFLLLLWLWLWRWLWLWLLWLLSLCLLLSLLLWLWLLVAAVGCCCWLLLLVVVAVAANDHLEDLASCKRSSEDSNLLQSIIRNNWPLANDHPEDPVSCK